MADRDTEEDKLRAQEAAAALIGEKRLEEERKDGEVEGSGRDAVDAAAETLSDQKKGEQR